MLGLISKKVQIGIIAAFVAAILALGMGLGAQPAYAKQNNTLAPGKTTTITAPDGVKYTVKNFTATSGLTLLKVSNTKSMKSLTIPEELKYNGTTFEVGIIAKQAFKGTKLTSVTLPSNVWKIKPYAFKGSKIKTVTVTTGKKTTTGKLLSSKKNVKKSLKGSKVKKIKCAKGAKALKKQYKKAFKKKNSGKKVKVK